MPKRTPNERWQEHVAERFALMVASQEFTVFRRRAMRMLGMRQLLKAAEWQAFVEESVRLPGYPQFSAESEELGRRFGLNGMTVRVAGLVRDYRLDQTSYVAESEWAKVALVTEVTDPDFALALTKIAAEMGLRVVTEAIRDTSSTMPLGEAKREITRPPAHAAFAVRVETPPHYPPEAAAQLHRSAQQAAREVLRRLGYDVPARLRGSALPEQAKLLRVGKEKLERNEIGDITEDTFGEEAALDRELRNRIKGRRSKLKGRTKRLGPI